MKADIWLSDRHKCIPTTYTIEVTRVLFNLTGKQCCCTIWHIHYVWLGLGSWLCGTNACLPGKYKVLSSNPILQTNKEINKYVWSLQAT